MPSPAEYIVTNYNIGKGEAGKFQFYRRMPNQHDPSEIVKKQNVPGPGAYSWIGMSSKGDYPLSTFKSSGAQNWSPAERFRNQKRSVDLTLGPGMYKQSDTDSVSGSYVLSNFKTGPKFRFGHPGEHLRTHSVTTRVVTPGPGTYLLPSDFGYLVDQNRSSPRDENPTRGGTTNAGTRTRNI